MHTPGPWNIVESVNYLDGFSRVCGSKGPIAKIISSVAGDAELIAAAPEMLDVLKLARVMLDAMIATSNGNIHDHCISTARRIDEVIQKVTGTDAAQTSAIGGNDD